MEVFEDGPLADGRVSQVQSLKVFMDGDGMHSVGSYVQVVDEGVRFGRFEWVPNWMDAES